MRKTLVLLATLAFSTSAMAHDLWDNDLIPDEVNARAISPPAFPDIRVVDDFVIPVGEDWVIQDFHTNIIEDAGWTDGGVAEIYIYDDNNNSPGNLIVTLSNLPFSKMSTGLVIFGREDFDYWIEDLNIPLGSGRYWIGLRFPNGGGVGTNYWTTSSGQPDGPDTSGWLSFDAGQTWIIEGNPDWDHAFTITGFVVNPNLPLWDNDLHPDEVNGRAISPPAFPDIRVVDDFVIPVGEEWVIQDFHTNIIEDAGWTDGGVAEIYIYDDNANSPGNLILSLSNLPFSKMDTGHDILGRDDFDYWIEDLNIPLGSGRYWIGLRFPNGGGAGTNYWMTSTGQPDGPDTSGWLSFDAGQTWIIEGDPIWDHAFTITGIILNPCPADFDDSGAVDVKDLLFLLGAWGPCPPKGNCPADFDDSGAVDVKDLLFLLGAWGPCPDANVCLDPGVCGQFQLCGVGEPFDCLCWTLFDGTGICLQDFPCNDVEDCPDGDCPPGFVCVVQSCCEVNKCVPIIDCNAGAAPQGPPTGSGLTGSGQLIEASQSAPTRPGRSDDIKEPMTPAVKGSASLGGMP